MPDAPADVRALYRHHARGNSLFRNLGDGTLRGRVDRGAASTMGRWAWASDTFDFDSDGWRRPLRRQRHADARGRSHGPRRLLLAAGGGAVAAHAGEGHAVRRGVARHQPAAGPRVDREPAAQRVPAQRRPRRLRRRLGRRRARPRSGRPIVRGARSRSRRRPGPRRHGGAPGAAAARLPQRASAGPGVLHDAPDRHRASNRDAIGARVFVETDVRQDARSCRPAPASCRSTRRTLHVRPRREPQHPSPDRWSGRRAGAGASPTRPIGTRVRLVEGGTLEAEPLVPRRTPAPASATPARPAAGRGADATVVLRTVPGAEVHGHRSRRPRRDRWRRSRASRRCCSSASDRGPRCARGARGARPRPHGTRRAPVWRRWPIALDAPADLARVRIRVAGRPAGDAATPELAIGLRDRSTGTCS